MPAATTKRRRRHRYRWTCTGCGYVIELAPSPHDQPRDWARIELVRLGELHLQACSAERFVDVDGRYDADACLHPYVRPVVRRTRKIALVRVAKNHTLHLDYGAEQTRCGLVLGKPDMVEVSAALFFSGAAPRSRMCMPCLASSRPEVRAELAELEARYRIEPVQLDRPGLRRLLAHPSVPRQGEVLELGCGTGEVSAWLTQMGYWVRGIDVSPMSVETARSKWHSRDRGPWFVADNVTRIRHYPDPEFDIVIDARCLHCVVGADRAAALRSIRRVLRPGGIFLVETMVGDPTAPEVLADFDRGTRCVVRDGVAVRYLGLADDVVGEIEAAGFNVLERWVVPPDRDGDQDDLLLVAERSQ